MTSLSLCQHAQCDAFQFTICRHCQLFLCIKHLAEHQQQFPSDFQRLLDDARRQQAQLSTSETRIVGATSKMSNEDVNSRYPPGFGQLNDEHDGTFDEESLFATFGGEN